MDTLTWTDGAANTLTLTDRTRLVVVGRSGFGLAETEIHDERAPGVPGGYFTEEVARARTVRLGLVGWADDAAGVNALRDELIAAFNPALGEGVLRVTRPDGTAWELTAVVVGGGDFPTSGTYGPLAVADEVVLRAHRPFWTRPDAQQGSVVFGAGDTFAFPVTLPKAFGTGSVTLDVTLTNPGTETAPVTVEFEGAGTNPKVQNLTQGLEVEVATTLSVGNTAVEFDAVDDYVEMGDVAALRPTAAVTLEAWVYATDAGVVTRYIAGFGTTGVIGYAVYQNGGATVTFRVGNGSVAATQDAPLALNAWNHVVGTYDGTTVKLFVNRSQVGAGAALTGPISYTGVTNFRIGQLGIISASRYWKGRLDEVAVYAAALASTRIGTHHDTALATGSGAAAYRTEVLADTPVGYWRLGESAGATAADDSGNGYAGTYNGDPTLAKRGAGPADRLRVTTGVWEGEVVQTSAGVETNKRGALSDASDLVRLGAVRGANTFRLSATGAAELQATITFHPLRRGI